jgi:hypothetical protein
MSGIFLVGSVKRWLERRSRAKRLLLAQGWPVATGEVNHWAIVDADEDVATAGVTYQIEAGFHFMVNGEYFGGYLRSVAMTHHEAEMKTKGSPPVKVRYDPADPDVVAVLMEDNATLPFRVISG